jgi:hypothetical protein
MEQALADYSRLIYALKAQLQTSHGRSPPVVVRRRPPS